LFQQVVPENNRERNDGDEKQSAEHPGVVAQPIYGGGENIENYHNGKKSGPNLKQRAFFNIFHIS
jgi:hypothetical protein